MQFYGLFGQSLKHSLSPEIHRYLYQMIGLDSAYTLFEIAEKDLGKAIEALQVLSISGVNVTIPYKEKVIPFLDQLSASAEKMGAVNTIKQLDGKLTGFNTDYDGFGLIFRNKNLKVTESTAAILGTGGAAKTAIVYLLDHGIKQLYIVSRNPHEKIQASDPKITYTNYEDLNQFSGEFLINTTPVGMYPDTNDCPVDEQVIQQYDTLIDLIYNPYETHFLKTGKAMNKKTFNGLDMLIGQAIKAVEIWHNCTIDPAVTQHMIERFTKKGSMEGEVKNENQHRFDWSAGKR